MHLGGCDALTRPFVADVERLLCRLDKIKPRGLMGIKALPFQIYEKVSEWRACVKCFYIFLLPLLYVQYEYEPRTAT